MGFTWESRREDCSSGFRALPLAGGLKKADNFLLFKFLKTDFSLFLQPLLGITGFGPGTYSSLAQLVRASDC